MLFWQISAAFPLQCTQTLSTKLEFTMKLRSLADWDRLSYNNLVYNNVRRAASSQHLTEFQGRLGRRRYIGNDTADVRAALPCCRLPDLRCSRYIRRSGTFCNIVRTQYLGTRILKVSQRKLTLRNWTG